MGTLMANVLGGLLMGGLLAVVQRQEMSDWWRLFAFTGFLGALTTFSTFSAEALQLLIRKDYAGVLMHSGAHLILSIGATVLAYALLSK